MAPIAVIFGSVFGAFSAASGWLLFGLSFWGAVQLYFCVGFAVIAFLIIFALVLPEAERKTHKTKHRHARAPQRV